MESSGVPVVKCVAFKPGGCGFDHDHQQLIDEVSSQIITNELCLGKHQDDDSGDERPDTNYFPLNGPDEYEIVWQSVRSIDDCATFKNLRFAAAPRRPRPICGPAGPVLPVSRIQVTTAARDATAGKVQKVDADKKLEHVKQSSTENITALLTAVVGDHQPTRQHGAIEAMTLLSAIEYCKRVYFCNGLRET
ncbi:hypothetical protein EVAR_9548_1 [Eumeta japonica]|uniref:Uncharacterized protein n=1 Tax=Eumeta variegata TaxID=151549 RepID=A0A4C1U4D1_EUMVA|nr:hypothetical protein EVAR_9548_1 [Eumeta japonica]